MSKKIKNEAPKKQIKNINDFYSGKAAPIVLALVAALLYIASAGFGYIGFDDKEIVLTNYNVLSDFSNVGETFKRDAFMSTEGKEFYRPIQSLTYMLDAQFSGREARQYHVTNVIIHAGATVAIFYLIGLLGFGRKEAFFATLIFAVNPLFSHAVSWIPSRGDLLQGLFGTLAFIWFVKFIREKKWEDLLIHAIFIFLTFFSKESGLLLPILFILWYFLIENKRKIEVQAWAAGAVWAVIGVAFLAARSSVVKVSLNEDQFGINAFLYNLRALPEFLGKFFVPLNLSGMPQYSMFSTIIGVALLVGIIILLFKSSENKRLIAAGFIWFLLTMIPQLLYRHTMGKYAYDYLEHRAYFPSIGLTIVLAGLFANIVRKYNFNSAKNIYLVIGGLFLIMAFVNSRRYADGYAFYNSEIRKNPDTNPMLYNNRGLLERETGRLQDAINDYKTAVKIYPEFDLAYNNLGVAQADAGDIPGAMESYHKAIALKPNYKEAWNNLGIAARNGGDTLTAIQAYEKVIKIDPKYYISWNNLGTIHSDRGELKDAIECYNKALEAEPRFAVAYFNRGRAYGAIGNMDAATSDFAMAAKLDPSLGERASGELNSVRYKMQQKIENPDAIQLINMAIEKVNAGDLDGAMQNFNRAAELAPNSPEVFNNRANLKHLRGDVKGACKDWKKALSLGFAGAQDMLDKYCK